jgi:hypothetical protein
MATRGSKKDLSRRHEDYIAQVYEGKRSKSSGAAVTDSGDVRTHSELFECKMTKIPSKFLKDFEKVALEARAEGKDPVLCYREYAPDSPLANHEGWVDITMRLTTDDTERGTL